MVQTSQHGYYGLSSPGAQLQIAEGASVAGATSHKRLAVVQLVSWIIRQGKLAGRDARSHRAAPVHCGRACTPRQPGR